jgi:hypothetical protein
MHQGPPANTDATMSTVITGVLITCGVIWYAARWRAKDPQAREGKVPPAFQSIGVAMCVMFLLALAISIFLAVSKG